MLKQDIKNPTPRLHGAGQKTVLDKARENNSYGCFVHYFISSHHSFVVANRAGAKYIARQSGCLSREKITNKS